MEYNIPRLIIAATHSGAGKTTMVTGLIAALRERGLKVKGYKVGPDYIDPTYHTLAAGSPTHNLDTWLMPPATLRRLFATENQGADIAIIEGVMGLYDGGLKGVSSTAEIAKLLHAPILLVLDVKSMGASAAAVALGFCNYDPEVNIAGVLLNRVGSLSHAAMIREALASLPVKLPIYGILSRNEELTLPERHLGLIPTAEMADEAVKVLDRLTAAVEARVNIEAVLKLARSAPLFVEETPPPVAAHDGEKVRIAVAQDEAFSFYYPSSLKVLASLGAEIIPFSPLHDTFLPEADGLILGGGFPEMYAKRLFRNTAMRVSIESAAFFGMPVYAECGGFMYLMDSMRDFTGESFPMTGVITGVAQMNKKLQTVGYVTATMERDTVLGKKGAVLRGHEFHFSTEQAVGIEYPRAYSVTKMRTGEKYLAGYAEGNVLGSYLHIHFAGCPEAAACFVEKCREYKRGQG
ncbi:MAG: cobyrinate a,c-diamide synthase [Selenomonadaceae bacterium]|nr:cobyrinate a,c-diamide synthase [Selenomonadaceae bacterium]